MPERINWTNLAEPMVNLSRGPNLADDESYISSRKYDPEDVDVLMSVTTFNRWLEHGCELRDQTIRRVASRLPGEIMARPVITEDGRVIIGKDIPMYDLILRKICSDLKKGLGRTADDEARAKVQFFRSVIEDANFDLVPIMAMDKNIRPRLAQKVGGSIDDVEEAITEATIMHIARVKLNELASTRVHANSQDCNIPTSSLSALDGSFPNYLYKRKAD